MPYNELEARERVRAWKSLIGVGASTKFGAGSELFAPGSPTDRIFLIEKGLAKLEVPTTGGSAAVALLFPGELAGLCCACLDRTHFMAATTLTESLIHTVETRRVLDDSSNLPNGATLLVKTLAASFKKTMADLVALKVETGKNRFESLLRELGSVAGKRPSSTRVALRLPITDAEIAALVSVTPEHLSRIKRELMAEGRLKAKGRVVDLRRA